MRSIWKYGAMGGCYDALHSGSSCSVLLIMVRWVVEFSTWVLNYSVWSDLRQVIKGNDIKTGRSRVQESQLTYTGLITDLPMLVE